LVTDRIRTGEASKYAIDDSAEGQIAQTCLLYLLYFKDPLVLTLNNIHEVPLAGYTAEHWTKHSQAAKRDTDRITELSLELFQSERDAFINWVRPFNIDTPWRGHDFSRSLGIVPSPLYYVSLAGLDKLVMLLLEKGAGVNAKEPGKHRTVIQAACASGHEAIVRLLLEHGADVNAQGQDGTALQEALSRGHEAVVRLLLEKGAEDQSISGGYR
jgi:ankyrin repeat protein